jgi:hypothetical protein
MTAKIVKLTNADLIGNAISDSYGGQAGRDVEDMMREKGYPVQNGPGVDVPLYDGFEIKSRDQDATSPQTIATMSPSDVMANDYRNSAVFDKMQKQYRVYHQNNVVVKNKLYDFSADFIQEKIEEAYENCRQELINGNTADYIYGNEYGYFERRKGTKSYSYRINKGAMTKLEVMASSTFGELFE